MNTPTIDPLTGAITATLTGASGTIVIRPSTAVDITLNLSAATFADTFLLESDADTIGDFLSIGNNASKAGFLYGGTGADTLVGGAQDDQLYGSAGNDSLVGNAGNDILDGGTGNDILIGGAGNDAYFIDSPNDQVIETSLSGAGTQDSVYFKQTSAVTYTLPVNVENLYFTGSANVNGTGNTSANIIISGAGNDTLNGGAGNDTLNGGAGNDSIDGGIGQDTLFGGTGNDTLIGGADTLGDSLVGGGGDDTYIVGNGDLINDSAGTDTVLANNTYSLASATSIENLTLTGTSPINGTGNALNNRITGNSANNSLDGGAGNDTLDGGVGNDSLFGGDGLDSLIGGEGNDTLNGASDSAPDTLVGGNGDDRYIIGTGDVITTDSGGIDTVETSGNYTLAGGLENLVLTGSALNGTGNNLANKITGNSGNNTLDGGVDTVNDTLDGGAGNDTYIIRTTGDVIIEASGGGTDSVQSSVTYTLGAEVENLTLTGTSAINGTGNGLANTITGNTGNNSLSGAAGADTLIGGAGNDTLDGGADIDSLVGGTGNDFYFWATGDVITENTGEGTDTVSTGESVTLTGANFENIENLILTGTGNINGTGNALANSITGNSGNNTLDGGAGNDTLIGGDGNDTLIGGPDTLGDSLVGGNGNDTYIVGTGDLINDSAGTDEVQSAVTFSVATFTTIENLTLTGTGNINGTGNALNNRITGNTGNNTLDGGAGNDTLIGGDGNDSLIGGTGTDSLSGGAGNDTYVVDATTDVVVEASGGGTDLVQSSVTYTLGAEVENLTLTGTGTINGTGNALNNTITGNSVANVLDGGAGADTLIGGDGNDVYRIDSLSDVVTETNTAASQVDTVQIVGTTLTGTYTLTTNVENLIFVTASGTNALNITGNASANNITGNAAANTINGLDGNDTINGGAGNDTINGGNGNDNLSGAAGGDLISGGAGIDTLTGGNGADVFAYGNLNESNFTNIDTITDFIADSLTGGASEVDKFDVPNAPITMLDADTNNPGVDAFVVSSLSLSAIQGVLTSTLFTPNTAAVVVIGTNTYLAINNGTAGFSGTDDALINITNIDDYTVLSSSHFI